MDISISTDAHHIQAYMQAYALNIPKVQMVSTI